MHWGRTRVCKTEEPTQPKNVTLMRAANAVAVIGSVVCVLFFCMSASNVRREREAYSYVSSAAAIQTFLDEHTAFADAIGLNAYFSGDSVSVGAFSDRGEEAYRAYLEETQRKWTFGEYLRDAVRSLFESP